VELAPDRGDRYAYLRPGEPGEEALLVVVNFGDEEARMRVALPRGFGDIEAAPALTDALNGEQVPGVNAGIPVAGGSARVLTAAAGRQR
jgi:hypothetical protein